MLIIPVRVWMITPPRRYTKTSKARTAHLSGQPKEKCFNDLMDGVMALWTQSRREDIRNQEGARTLDLARNEDDIRTWLQSTEEST